MKTLKSLWFPTLMLVTALLVTLVANAQVPMNERLHWTAPQSYTDDTPIAPGDLSSYTISCGTQSGSYILTMVVPGDTTQATRAALMENMGLVLGGEYRCAVQATTANQLTSAYSNEVHFVLPDERVPAAPVLSTQ